MKRLIKVFSEGWNLLFLPADKIMVILSDSLFTLDPSCEWSSLRDLSGTDLMGHWSIYTTKLANWWMCSMCRSTRYILRSIYIPS